MSSLFDKEPGMAELIWEFLYNAGLQPHGYCLLWQPGLFWSHVIADLVIAASYFSIPVVLVVLARRRVDPDFRWVLHLFGAFIVACGVTHLFGIWTMWTPSYGAEAVAKVLTAAISVVTATMLWPLLPKLIALPSPQALEEANNRLKMEIEVRRKTEAQLAALNRELEERVTARTRKLEELNRDLREARAEAERSANAKSDFLATMSHEIRTPMNGVLGMLALMREGDLDEPQTERLEIASRSASALMTLIDDVLDLAKIEAGGILIQEEPFAPREVFDDVFKLFEPTAHEKGLEFELVVGPEVPEKVIGDPFRLRQIVTNLTSNALKFTETGAVRIRVFFDPGEGACGQIRCTVEDTGIGIEDDALTNLFSRFTQADSSTTRRYGGTGLGLAICKQLAELMGGTIKVKSTVGRGSRFQFAVPIGRQDRRDQVSAVA